MQGSSVSTTLVSGLPIPSFAASAFKPAGTSGGDISADIKPFSSKPLVTTFESANSFASVPTFTSLVVTTPAALGSVTTVVSTVFPVTALVVFDTSVTGLA